MRLGNHILEKGVVENEEADTTESMSHLCGLIYIHLHIIVVLIIIISVLLLLLRVSHSPPAALQLNVRYLPACH